MKHYEYGLTGNIASGKSTVADRLRTLGLVVFDMDKIGHKVFEYDRVKNQVVHLFDESILKEDQIDRDQLRKKAFNDKEKLKELQELIHPEVQIEYVKLREKAFRQGEKIVIREAAILVESRTYQDLEGLLVVTCPEMIRLQRLLRRPGITKEVAQKIINSQMPESKKVNYATWVIENSGTMSELIQSVDDWVKTVVG